MDERLWDWKGVVGHNGDWSAASMERVKGESVTHNDVYDT